MTQPNYRQQRPFMLKPRLLFRLVLAFVVLLIVTTSTPTFAQDSSSTDITKLTQAELVSPSPYIRKMLSGRMWLISEGLDPTLGIGVNPQSNIQPFNGPRTVQPQAGGGGAALVPYRDPSTKFSRNVLIPRDFSQFTFQTEPSLAVDPLDPDHILVGLIDYNFPGMVSYSTIDGGVTWEGPYQVKYPRQDLAAAGDPIVAFDRNGTAYYAFISLDVEEFTVGPLLGSSVVSAISLNRSTDGGFTWEDPVRTTCDGVSQQPCNTRIQTTPLPSSDQRTRGRIDMQFLDKPWMAIGPNPKHPDKDVIYIAYTKFIESSEIFWIDELPTLGAPSLETVIELVKSEDGGVTWSTPIEVSPRATYTILLNPVTQDPTTQQEIGQGSAVRQIVQGPSVSVAPDGTLYVAWLDTTDDDSFEGLAEIHLRRSDDAATSFKAANRVSGFLEPGFTSRHAPFRSWSSAFPKLGTGPQGEVYVLWVAIPADNPEDDGDVFFSYSTNKGESWSRRKNVNDDETDHFQFFPEISVDPNGVVHTMWADMRDDPNEVSYHIYYASSEDGGKSWSPNSRVTDFPTNPNRSFPGGRFIGDYFGIAATDNDVYMTWADGRLGEFGPLNQKIGFARKRLMPNPSIFISPPSGPGGKDVIIQGFNFQPDRDIFIEVAGVIVSTARTQNEGRFTTQIFVPIAGQGAHSVRAIDASGNVAASSFFMDFGFDTIQKATDQIAGISKQFGVVDGTGGTELESLRATVKDLRSQLNAFPGTTSDDGSRGFLVPLVLVAGSLISLLLIAGLLGVTLRRTRQ